MNRFQYTLVATISASAMAFGAVNSRAADVLDQQLGQDGPTTAPAPINPAAAKAVDDADLVKQLTNPAGDKAADPSEQLHEMVDRMSQSQSRLSDKDVGPLTQETQRRIVTDLDVLIETVRKQQQQSKSQPKPGEQKPQPRQPGQNQKQGNEQQPGSKAAQNSQLSAGAVDNPQSNGTDYRQTNAEKWGDLPPKDRDLISNGVNEQYLPAYKEMIDRYYQALAEVGKSKDRP